MQPLPAAPCEISTWSYKRKVSKNAHVVSARNSIASLSATLARRWTFASRKRYWRSIGATNV